MYEKTEIDIASYVTILSPSVNVFRYLIQYLFSKTEIQFCLLSKKLSLLFNAKNLRKYYLEFMLAQLWIFVIINKKAELFTTLIC